MAVEAAPETRIKVFISYSRADKAFASDLVLGLAACGFAPYIDRQDIAAGEDWEKRLAGLITEADSVVYVISPDSLGSENCAQEFRQAIALQKRILPVVWRAVEDAAAPPEMKRLNYIFFAGEGRTFAAGLADLAAALRTDIDWIREHTRLSDVARRWSARGRSGELLLRGDDIDAANAWLAGKPITAPAITDEQADFIKASSDARVEAERKARRARAGLLTAVSIAALVFAGLAGLAGLAWALAESAEKKATTLATDLQSKNLRLEAEVWLRTAPSPGKNYYVIEKGWYPIAAGYSGAISRVELSGGGHQGFVSTGFLIDGGLVAARYSGEPLLLVLAEIGRSDSGSTYTVGDPSDTLVANATRQWKVMPGTRPADTLSANADPQVQRMLISADITPGPEKMAAIFPALSGEDAATAIDGVELVWERPPQVAAEPRFQIWRLAKRPPAGWKPIGQPEIDCDDSKELPAPADRTIAILGIAVPAEGGPSRRALALNISDLLDRSDPSKILYTHSTNVASGGAPVFNLVTGKVFGIHLGSEPYQDAPGFRIGFGYSLRFLLNVVRGSVKGEKLAPLCEG